MKSFFFSHCLLLMEKGDLIEVVEKDKPSLELRVCVESREVGDLDKSLIVSQPHKWGKVGDYDSGYIYKLELIDFSCPWTNLSCWKIIHVLSTSSGVHIHTLDQELFKLELPH